MRPFLLNHDLQGVEKLYCRLFITSDINVYDIVCKLALQGAHLIM